VVGTNYPESRIVRQPLGITDNLDPARRLKTDCRAGSANEKIAFFARSSVRYWSMSLPKPSRSSNSRTRISPQLEVTRDP
jgi:hypothetical protein